MLLYVTTATTVDDSTLLLYFTYAGFASFAGKNMALHLHIPY